MKKLQSLVFLVTFLTFAGIPASSGYMSSVADVGEYFAPFTGPSYNGGTFDLADHYNKGKYTFVNYWASW